MGLWSRTDRRASTFLQLTKFGGLFASCCLCWVHGAVHDGVKKKIMQNLFDHDEKENGQTLLNLRENVICQIGNKGQYRLLRI